MDWKVFLLRVSIALLLGALIGAERQLRQRLTGLRTNALVSTGACLFVLMTRQCRAWHPPMRRASPRMWCRASAFLVAV